MFLTTITEMLPSKRTEKCKKNVKTKVFFKKHLKILKEKITMYIVYLSSVSKAVKDRLKQWLLIKMSINRRMFK